MESLLWNAKDIFFDLSIIRFFDMKWSACKKTNDFASKKKLKTLQKLLFVKIENGKSSKSRKHYIVCDVIRAKALRAFTRMTFDRTDI